MLSSYPVSCPHANCGWTGNLVPSHLRGGAAAEIVSMHRAWFRCPRCQGDWEVRITDDRVTVLPAVEAITVTTTGTHVLPCPTCAGSGESVLAGEREKNKNSDLRQPEIESLTTAKISAAHPTGSKVA